MKTIKLSVLAIISFVLLSLSSCKNDKKTESKEPVKQEETAISEGEHKIIFENVYAKVSKISLAPGQVQPIHQGGSRVIYALTNFSIDWEEQGKKLGTKTWKKGDVHFHDAGKHAAKNNGTTKAEWLVFTKKNKDLPDSGENTVENDVTSVSPDFSKSLFENEAFKITKVNLPKGESIPKHSGVNRIIYSLSDYTLNYKSDAKGKTDKAFKSGDMHWHEASQHALQNNGETEAKYLVISYKRK